METTNVVEVATRKLQGQLKTKDAQIADLKAKLSEASAKVDVDKVHLQAKLDVVNRQLRGYIKTEEKAREYTAAVTQAVEALDPLPQVTFLKPKKSKTPITAVCHATDWHIGERIQATETEGWGGFDWQKAQDRVAQFCEGYLKWLDIQRSGYVINDIHLINTGDMVSGDIHDELRRTNEFPLPVQTAKAAQLFAHLAETLAPHCERLIITEVGADNHSRLVQKPQAKQKSSNSMSYLVFELANEMLKKHTNVEITRAEGMKHLTQIGKFPFLIEHGDSIKSWMGVPWYGMERERAREASRRMMTDKGFKYMLIGHWHQHFFGPIIVGGCLGGTSEYDHSCGRVSAPCQTGFLVGKRGAFGFVPFELR